MVIKLDGIFDNIGAESVFDYTIDLSKSDIPEDSRFVGGIKCKGTVANKSGTVELAGTAEFDYSAECDRCAAEVLKSFAVPLRHKLISHLDGEDNDEYIVVSDALLDLDKLIYEDVILSLPMRFLCREDCKGLCPVCGQDLNVRDCGCKKPGDPRLDALRQLLEN